MNRYTVIKRKRVSRRLADGYDGYTVKLYMGASCITTVHCHFHKTALQLARDWESNLVVGG